MPKLKAPAEVQRMADELRRVYGGMMSTSQIQAELGVASPKTARKFSEGIPSVLINGRRRFRVSDVAQKIYSNLAD